MEEKFAVQVVERPEASLVGLQVRTSMDKAGVDCPALWERFGPRMAEASGKMPAESFGVSTDMEENGGFSYWAAVPGQAGHIPADMLPVTLPAGLYARCQVKSLGHLGAVYTFLYQEWGAGQENYAVNFAAPCFERYDAAYLKDGSLEVFVPLVRK